MDHEGANEFEEQSDKLANLQILTGKENESKQDTPFEEWITDQEDTFYDRHLIPRDPECHRIENFDQFLERRGELIKSELISMLGTPPEDTED